MAVAEPPQVQLIALKRGSEEFYSRFVRVGAAGLCAMCLLGIVLGAATKQVAPIAAGALGIVINGTSIALTYRGGGLPGRRLFVYGLLLTGGLAAAIAPPRPQSVAVYMGVAAVSVTLAGFALTRVDLLASAAVGLLIMVLSVERYITLVGFQPETTPAYMAAFGLVVVQVVAVSLFTRHAQSNQQKLHTYVEEVDRVMVHAQRIAKGDLGGTVEGDSEVSETIRTMLEGLRTMVMRTREAAAALSSSAQEIAAMARQQEQGAVEQASAVAQVHKTLARLLEGSSFAAQSTEEVFRNVELTQKTSEVVAQRASALSAHTRRISALLEVIKSIANKSEILALNAALEGARAGGAGRGFSLVASQMQRLAESVMGSVRDVRALVEDIEGATGATLSATEESTRLSARATAAARQISVTLQQQRGSTEQVATAMRDIQEVTALVAAGSTQSLSATQDLTRLAGELKLAIEGFRG